MSKELNMTAKLVISESGLWHFSTAYALNDNLGIMFSGITSNSNSFITVESNPNSGNIAKFRKKTHFSYLSEVYISSHINYN